MIHNGELVLVTGAGGFIGGHLVADLLSRGIRVRAVDKKPLEDWYQRFEQSENRQLDLRALEACKTAVQGASEVYNLAADMGGIGFIENNKALCMQSVLINTQLLMAAAEIGVDRYLYSSSACVYSADKQKTNEAIPLREEDAYPAMPEDGYGWEKLFSERMCRHMMEDFGLNTRVARLHNVYGPHGAWNDGREKAPAAVCRKVAQAKFTGRYDIDIWGDGMQTRSFLYIDDCVSGLERLMKSDAREPINLGSEQVVTINQLVGIVEEIAGVKLERRYDHSAPQGVRGRSSDNTRLRESLGWEPQISLESGLEPTFDWIYGQVQSQIEADVPASP